jgi:hypothetical protein
MSREIGEILVEALRKYADTPLKDHPERSTGNIKITINGEIHFHCISDPFNFPVKMSVTPSSRSDLIAAIQKNAGRYFHKSSFSSLLIELFQTANLHKMPLDRLKKVWIWSVGWNKCVVAEADS